MKGSDNVSIEWESSGYSVLKNLKATIVGIFTEFIDNSIQSFKNDKDKIKLIEQIKNQLNEKICIRSSFYKEDSAKSSLAGKFDSFIRVLSLKRLSDSTAMMMISLPENN